MSTRLITLTMIRTEKIGRSRSWILAEVAGGRFPQPVVRSNPNLWDEAHVDRWLVEFVERSRVAAGDDAPRIPKALAAKRNARAPGQNDQPRTPRSRATAAAEPTPRV